MTNKNKEIKKTSKKIVDISQELAEIKEGLRQQNKELAQNTYLMRGVDSDICRIANDLNVVYDGNKISEIALGLNKKFRCLAYALTANVIIGSIILLNILLRG